MQPTPAADPRAAPGARAKPPLPPNAPPAPSHRQPAAPFPTWTRDTPGRLQPCSARLSASGPTSATPRPETPPAARARRFADTDAPGDPRSPWPRHARPVRRPYSCSHLSSRPGSGPAPPAADIPRRPSHAPNRPRAPVPPPARPAPTTGSHPKARSPDQAHPPQRRETRTRSPLRPLLPAAAVGNAPAAKPVPIPPLRAPMATSRQQPLLRDRQLRRTHDKTPDGAADDPAQHPDPDG